MKNQKILTALSVNLNKVALIRNTRHLGIPSVIRAAQFCLEAGAHGITVHPRPDFRHIRKQDVFDLSDFLQNWKHAEFNIEGNPFHNLMDYVRELRPHQVTFVPDNENQFTSDHGWNLPSDCKRLEALIQEVRDLGVRVSLFMDAEPKMMRFAREIGADRVELYTESWASVHAKAQANADFMAEKNRVLNLYIDSAQAAIDAGLGVNAGHDLSLENLSEFVKALPKLHEVSIGHALVSDALELGYTETVKAYLRCITNGLE